MKHLGFCVAKVVKTFGFLAFITETLDEFRYQLLHSVDLTDEGEIARTLGN